LLGGGLAQRQAALREVMAAGALSTFTFGLPCVPMISRAACVPKKKLLWKLGVIRLKANVDEECDDGQGSIANFDEEKKFIYTNNANLMLRLNDETVDGSCRPKLTAHDYDAGWRKRRFSASRFADLPQFSIRKSLTKREYCDRRAEQRAHYHCDNDGVQEHLAGLLFVGD
jgi:hypothetical protein